MSDTNMDHQLTEDIYAAALAELDGTESAPRLPEGTGQTYVHTGNDYQPNANSYNGQQQPYGNQPNYYGFAQPPVAVVTTEDLENRKPPMPRLFKNERVVGVYAARPGEVKFKPRQPRSIPRAIFAIVMSLILVASIGYVALVATKRAPVPAAFMFGSTRTAGKTLSNVGDTSKAPYPSLEEFENVELAEPYVQFATALLDDLEPANKAYGALGLELASSNIPNLKEIHNLNELARAQVPMAKSSLLELAIPESLPPDAIKAMGKAITAGNAMLDQGTNVSDAVAIGAQGSPTGFGDAAFAADNMKRNRDNVYAELRRAERAIGLKADTEKGSKEGAKEGSQEGAAEGTQEGASN